MTSLFTREERAALISQQLRQIRVAAMQRVRHAVITHINRHAGKEQRMRFGCPAVAFERAQIQFLCRDTKLIACIWSDGCPGSRADNVVATGAESAIKIRARD